MSLDRQLAQLAMTVQAWNMFFLKVINAFQMMPLCFLIHFKQIRQHLVTSKVCEIPSIQGREIERSKVAKLCSPATPPSAARVPGRISAVTCLHHTLVLPGCFLLVSSLAQGLWDGVYTTDCMEQ